MFVWIWLELNLGHLFEFCFFWSFHLLLLRPLLLPSSASIQKGTLLLYCQELSEGAHKCHWEVNAACQCLNWWWWRPATFCTSQHVNSFELLRSLCLLGLFWMITFCVFCECNFALTLVNILYFAVQVVILKFLNALFLSPPISRWQSCQAVEGTLVYFVNDVQKQVSVRMM